MVITYCIHQSIHEYRIDYPNSGHANRKNGVEQSILDLLSGDNYVFTSVSITQLDI